VLFNGKKTGAQTQDPEISSSPLQPLSQHQACCDILLSLQGLDIKKIKKQGSGFFVF